MADFSTLIASIEETIKTNGVQAITGQILQDEMLLMVSAINQLKQDTLEGYAFYGEPIADGGSASVTQNTFFLVGRGTYTINGNSVPIANAGVSVIVYNSVTDSVTSAALFPYDDVPTEGSDNAVTSGAVAAALAEIPANFAACLYDRRSAGTPQSPYTFRQSGGDGVDYLKSIKGRTLVWNQLVKNGDTEVATISGHQYLTRINGVDSIITSTGASIAISDSSVDNVFDLTLLGWVPSSVSEFRAVYPLSYYSYTPALLINNAATDLESTGFNQMVSAPQNFVAGSFPAFDKNIYTRVFGGVQYYFRHDALGVANWRHMYRIYDLDGNEITSNPFIGVPSGSPYYSSSSHIWLDAGNYALSELTIAFAKDCYVYFGYGSGAVTAQTEMKNACLNLSDPSRNGTYEPYWKATRHLGLDSFEATDGENVITVNGLKSAGSVYDEIIEGKKYVKRIETRAYQSGDENNSAVTTDGTNTNYPLATPEEYELVEPIQPMLEVDELGTERRLPEDTAAAVNAPFESDSNYSVSVANLVRKLSE